ncbi:apiosidase-like domain-containing protein [Bacillus solitudinis]|uniref:apiosidase-like domain-containing protein n=1 Tax=Bacillus solitudinis TaxID=2014074 RepID=UPI001D0D6BE1
MADKLRYLTYQDGTAFIWLADTIWIIAQRLKWSDIEYLIQKRKSQGFTVLQMVALDPEQNREMRNPAGDKALLNNFEYAK